MDTFRVRLNCIDHYQAVPNDEFDPPVPLATASSNVNVPKQVRRTLNEIFFKKKHPDFGVP